MTGHEVDDLLRCFRRRMAYSVVTRWFLVISVVAAFATAGPLSTPGASRLAVLWLVIALVAWLLLMTVSVRTARRAQVAAALLSIGRLDEAEQELGGVLRSFSIFRSTLLTASQQLGMLLHARRNHEQAGKVFRTVLRSIGSRLGRPPSFETTVRLLWADCELAMGNLHGAYDAFQPVFGASLTLSERLLLLPIELRYELATGHTRNAIANLPEKLRHAELLEAPQAAWVHKLLAEACRREGMHDQAEFLQRRAALYHDPADLPATLDVIGESPVEGVVP